ncbi:MAG: CoA-binding protein [Cyanobacteria bacterium SBLK]|nr:CoA-binding protein [Cyanobacteria bacterium SBLK]
MHNWTQERKVLIQGIAEPLAIHAVAKMKAYGTNIVAGIGIGRGGSKIEGVPVFELVEEATARVGAIYTSILFVPPNCVLDAALEAMAANIHRLILVTDRVPPLDMMRLFRKARDRNTLILGGGSQGLILPGKVLLGICEAHCYTPGNVALISRGSGLLDEVAWALTRAGIGQSMAIDLGSSEAIGSGFDKWLGMVVRDRKTKAIALLESAMMGNEEAANFIPNNIRKPIFAYISGRNVPITPFPQDTTKLILSQCSAPIPHSSTAEAKLAACDRANIPIADSPTRLAKLLQETLKEEVKRKRKPLLTSKHESTTPR